MVCSRVIHPISFGDLKNHWVQKSFNTDMISLREDNLAFTDFTSMFNLSKEFIPEYKFSGKLTFYLIFIVNIRTL